jgi:hypothetical protein
LSHLGFAETGVHVVQVVEESRSAEWHYVREGLCSRERALQVFHAFFQLDGRERFSHVDP